MTDEPRTDRSAPWRRGLGDRIGDILARLGLHGWEGCGCRRRRERLNRLGWRILDKLEEFGIL